jgi:hypothetical protein
MTALVLLLGAVISLPSLPQSVDYDTFMAQSVADRVREVRKLSPEARADLLTTHIKRWRDANDQRLNADQRQMIQDWLAHVTPDLYREPGLQEKMQRTRDLEKRTETVFSREEMAQAFSLSGHAIPAKKLES